MPGASSGLMGVIEAAQRRRRGVLTRDAGYDPAAGTSSPDLGSMEPDITMPRQLSDRYMARQHATDPSELSQRYASGNDKEEPFFIQHPYAASFLAALGGSLSRRPGGGEEAVRTLAQARNDYRRMKERDLDRKMEEDRRREIMRMEEARHRENLGVQLGAPSLAGDQGMAGAIEAKRQREEQRRQEDQARADAQRQETLNKPMTVSPEQGVWDPKARQWIVPPRFRPTREPAGRANQERDDAEKAMGTITKLRNQSIDWNSEMESIRTSAEKGRGKGQMPWDEPATDPKTGYALGLSKRQRYEALKKKNAASVGEINRLWGNVRRLRGDAVPLGTAASAPRSGGGGTQEYGRTEIEALRRAMDDVDREEFDAMTPEDQRKVLDSAYGRSSAR